MDLLEIVQKYLTENGFDGLYQAGECACGVDDLFCCGNPAHDCEPGYLRPCDCGDHDWHIGPEKTS